MHAAENVEAGEQTVDINDSPESDDESDLYTCMLGTHGQVILTKPNSEAVLSRFEFTYPANFQSPDICKQSNGSDKQHCLRSSDPGAFIMDEDGDIVVKRQCDVGKREGIVMIEHQQSTSLLLVGEQLWRGALYLSDYLLHSVAQAHTTAPKATIIGPEVQPNYTNEHQTEDKNMVTSKPDSVTSCDPSPDQKSSANVNHSVFVDVTGQKVLELAAGVGLTSIVAGMVAKSVLVTDINLGSILKLINSNFKLNDDLVTSSVAVSELDFCNHSTIDALEEQLQDVTVILAADVVYHNALTDHFFSAVHRIMSAPPSKVLLVALEKRYVFTTADLDTVAPCYEYFLQGLRDLQANTSPHPGVRCTHISTIEWRVERITQDIPQYFVYERNRHLVLWKIEAILK